MTLLSAVVFASLLTAIMWLPYLIGVTLSQGVGSVLAGNPKQSNKPIPEWATRINQAHRNAVENLPAFIGVSLVAHINGQENHLLELAAAVYCTTRLAHLICYTFAIPVLRTLCFVLSWLCILFIGYVAIV